MKRTGREGFAWRAMASPVQLLLPSLGEEEAGNLARRVASDLIASEQALSRFWPGSDLTRLNSHLGEWVPVPRRLRLALVAARRAKRLSGGVFDAAVLQRLEALGYPGAPLPDVGRRQGGEAISVDSRRGLARLQAPVDLGGIGKGLAIRWASRVICQTTPHFLLNIGGDISLGGTAGDDGGWLVGVEDPLEVGGLVAALRLAGPSACATSSTARHRWRLGSRLVHHLIDPATGEPVRTDLLAVTVLHDDPAWAEVHTKVLFAAGKAAIRERAAGMAALWVDEEGRVGWTKALSGHLTWVADGRAAPGAPAQPREREGEVWRGGFETWEAPRGAGT